MDVPGPIRILALALAAVTVLLNGGGALNVVDDQPIFAAGYAITGLLFTLPLLWVAAFPASAGPRLHRWLGLDLREGRHVVAAVVHFVVAYLIFGQVLISTTYTASQYLSTGQHPAQDSVIPSSQIIQGLVLNLVLFAVAAITWIYLVDDRTGEEAARDLGLAPRDAVPGVAYGLGMTLAVLVGLAGLGYALQALGIAPENPQADAIADALSPTTAIVVAALAGIGEELYFRGFLLPRTNNLTQALLFGAIHATYLTAFQVLIPFLLGLALGWLRERTSLWSAIVTHASYNAVVLLIAVGAFGDLSALWIL